MHADHRSKHPPLHPFIIMCLLSEKDYHPQVDLVLCCSGGWLGEKADKVHCWRSLAPAQGNGSRSVGNRWRGVYSIQRNCQLSSYPACCGLNVCVYSPHQKFISWNLMSIMMVLGSGVFRVVRVKPA